MSIDFSRYVDIISGVGGGAAVRQREFMMRVFSPSQLISPDVVLEFTEATDVGTFFGTGSEEFRRATRYLGYVSPNVSKPKRISFAKDSGSSNPAMVIGNNDFKAIAGFNAVIAGEFAISLDGEISNVTGADLSAAADLDAVATAIQVIVRTLPAPYDTATVTFGIGRPSAFVISVPDAPDGTKIEVLSTATGANNLADLMGLLSSEGALNISASVTKSPVESFMRAEQITNNFGSFVFQAALTLNQIEELAAYNASRNVMYQYHVGVKAADAQAWYDALKGYAGLGLTLSPIVNEYPEQIPCAILAATDYSKRGSVQNYMFKRYAGVSSSVSTNTDADKYDALRINYYGDTSTAGQRIEFYQRGKLMGGPTAPVDMNVYGNEQWLKDRAGADIMGLLLSIGRMPANIEGQGMLYTVLEPVVDAAKENGVISSGKTLTAVQKVFISQQTGDDLAWQKVQSSGAVLSVWIEPYTTVDGSVEYKALYRLIYSKDDAVRKVEGTHQLI